MKQPVRFLFFIVNVVMVFLLLFALAGCGSGGGNTAGKTKGFYADVAGRKGNITTAASVEIASQAVAAAGGTFEVSSPGSPLDGFVIDVPANTYANSTNFKVSYAPITQQSFGNDINPVSPMIHVDNGGAYSLEPMYVRVPVTVPDGYFAMGFYYDETSKTLEGMPVVGKDDKSITVAARHFSNFFISSISEAILKTDIDSGFRPGVDDWQFTNYGSYIAPGGHCEGQSVTALWYYCTRPDGQNTHLYGKYDNNGDQPATPGFWQDDSRGYRFASVIQKNIDPDAVANNFWLNTGGKNWILENHKWKMVDVPGVGDAWTWNMFAYAMRVTGEPQLVVIWSAKGGHAMIVYRINEGNLYIADPNYPGNTGRRIEYSNGKFSPYNSGANAAAIEAGKGEAYPTIQYYAKSTVLAWSVIDAEWALLKSGGVGNSEFPAYQLKYINDQGKPEAFNDKLVTKFDAVSFTAYATTNTIDLAVALYKDGAPMQHDAKYNYDLEPGDNRIGVFVVGKANGSWSFVDFKYVTVTYEAATTTKANKGGHPVITGINGPTGSVQELNDAGSASFSVDIEGGTPPYTVTWRSDRGDIASGQSVSIPVNMLRWNGEGYWVWVTVDDAAGEGAAWLDDVGMSHSEFTYGVTYNGIVIQPNFPYRSFQGQ